MGDSLQPMEGKLNIAWATQVDHVQLGARLEAYVDTRSEVRTFERIAHFLGQNIASGLPVEIVKMITDHLKDISYRTHINKWHQAKQCCQQRCSPRFHFTTQQLHDEYGIGCVGTSPSNSDIDDQMYEDTTEMHEEAICWHRMKITTSTNMGPRMTFASCREIFDRDFGIRPLFTVLSSYDSEADSLEAADISAYLVIPLQIVSLKSRCGPNKGLWTIGQALPTTEPITEAIKQRFKRAIKAVRLDAPHEYATTKRGRVRCPSQSNGYHKGIPDDEDDSEDQVLFEIEEDSPKNRVTKALSTPVIDSAGYLVDIIGNSAFPSAQDQFMEVLYCLDCGNKTCRGSPSRISEPETMILGSGELDAFCADY